MSKHMLVIRIFSKYKFSLKTNSTRFVESNSNELHVANEFESISLFF